MDYYPCGIALFFTCLGAKERERSKNETHTNQRIAGNSLAVAAIRTTHGRRSGLTPNPQTEYAKRFIAACDGQTGSSMRLSVC